jgi:hypothetical protein
MAKAGRTRMNANEHESWQEERELSGRIKLQILPEKTLSVSLQPHMKDMSFDGLRNA